MRRLVRTPLVVAAALVVAAGILSAQQSVFTPGGTLPLLDAYLEPLRLQAGIPGMSAAVLSDGKLVWEKGYGFQNVATRERPTADTPYLVGDMSGTLAAVLLLQCVEQRRVGLDDPFSRYGLTAPEPEATLRGILSHAPPASAREPFVYSPERYESLTALMEWCAPQSYRKSVAHRVLKRLAMQDSVPGTDLLNPEFSLPEDLFDADEIARYRRTLARIALPYKVTGRTRIERSEIPQIPISASGGLVTTARDLSTLDSWLDQRDLLLDETLEAAWRPAADRSGTPSPMGLGWFVQYYRNERVVWHFGFVPNAYSSLILKLPDRKLTFILLANSDGLSAPYNLQAGDVTRSVFAALFLRLTT
jgi:CubicO group peptidase (beta-lactamase class C family)